MEIEVRRASGSDDADLARIDAATWRADLAVGPARPAGEFFTARVGPADVLVAVVGGTPAGYVQLGNAIPVPSHAHVLEVHGLAVDPAAGRRGVGRALLAAAVDEARRRGAAKLTLRVLAPNAPARALYASAGFVEEGLLRAEFRIAGRDVDDVLMALRL